MGSFANYSTGYDYFRLLCKGRRKPSYDDYVDMAVPKIVKRQGRVGMIQVQVESAWMAASRPYYKVWPSIADALLRIRFDLDSTLFAVPCGTLCLRFIEHAKEAIPSVQAILINDTAKHGNSGGRGLTLIYQKTGGKRDGFIGLALLPGETVQCALDRSADTTARAIASGYVGGADKLELSFDEETQHVGRMCLKCAMSVCLLANDPDSIIPDVLSVDRRRFDESTDPEFRKRLIDKARKRGVVGWRVGEQYETIPHYRRPHPALYHVGKGRKEQLIIFRAGAIVHRKKMTEVPTGYIDDDGTEIE